MEELKKIIHPVEVNTFLTEYFEKKHLHITNRSDNYYHDYLNSDIINSLLSDKIQYHPDTKLVKLIDDKVETAPATLKDSNIIDVKLLMKYFSEGYTLVLNSLHKKMPSLWDYANAMSHFFGCVFQTNVYITPGGEQQGFNVHHDTHDVFIMQIEGEKKWQFFESPIHLANKDLSFIPGEHIPGPVIDEITLRQGDFFYVPRGLMHCAKSTGEKSIHITGGLMNLTWKDLFLERITSLAQEHDVLRQTFQPGYWNGQNFSENEKQYQEILSLLNNKEVLKTGFENLKDFTNNSVPSRIIAPLDILEQIKHLKISSFVEMHENLMFRVEQTEELLTIHIYHQKIELPIEFLPIIEYIIEKKKFAVGSLPDILEDDDKVEFISSLISEGFLTPVF